MDTSDQSFQGFPQEGLRFLANLRANNNREWFQENRNIFDNSLIKPSQAFVETIGPRLKIFSPGLSYDTRKNGRGSIMRIYRDIRFSKDKTPYYTYMRFRFWEGSNKVESPGIFIWLDEKGAGIHLGMHKFPKDFLLAYRNAVLDDRIGSQLVDILETFRQSGEYEIAAPHYKRVPRGYDADHPRSALLRHNTLYISCPVLSKSLLKKPELVDVCLDHIARMIPLHHWLLKIA